MSFSIIYELPSTMLGRVWPDERGVAGLRVCKWLRQQLIMNAEGVLLRIKSKPVVWSELGCNLSDYPEHVTSSGAMSDFLRFKQPFQRVMVELGANSDCPWYDALHEGLMEAISQGLHRNLVHLNMLDNAFDDELVATFAPCLRQCTALAHLNLSLNEEMSTDSTEVLLEAVSGCTQLAHLDLSHTCIEMGALVRALGHLQGLTSLDLSGNHLEGEWEQLAQALGGCGELRYLSLSESRLSAGAAEALARGLRRCRRLEHLDLSASDLDPLAAHQLAAGLAQLQGLAQLELRQSLVGKEAALELASQLPQCRALTALDLSGTRIGGAGVSAVLEAAAGVSGLRRLQLADTEADRWPGLLRLGGGEGCELEHLVLCNNKLCDATLGALPLFLGRCKGLRVLDLRCNRLNEVGALALAEALAGCGQLAQLELSHNRVGSGAGLERLAEVLLGECSALTALSLAANALGPEGAFQLAARLLSLPHALQRLDLSANALADDGAASLALALHSGACSALHQLRLNSNGIAERGLAKLAPAARRCPALLALELFDNPLPDLLLVEAHCASAGKICRT